MLIEYCDGGALDSIIVDLEKGLTEKQIAYVCREMCRLVFFSSQNIALQLLLKIEYMHFDLANDNTNCWEISEVLVSFSKHCSPKMAFVSFSKHYRRYMTCIIEILPPFELNEHFLTSSPMEREFKVHELLSCLNTPFGLPVVPEE